MHVFMKTVLSMIGSIRIRSFTSSTCVTVHSLQAPGFVDVDEPSIVGQQLTAARSKNLGRIMMNMVKKISLTSFRISGSFYL